jgi:GntR family transcriptional regulator, transcriptional repressor for pyruvate dehydrogenase complex
VTVDILPLARHTLAEDAARQLSALILDGKLGQGDRLPSLRALAAQFGVSVPTIREAVSFLVTAGALEAKVGAGIFVKPNGANPEHSAFLLGLPGAVDEVDEFFDAREVIESAIARYAAERRTEDDLNGLRALLAALERASEDAEAFMEADVAIHLAVAQMARNRPLLRVMLAMRSALRSNMRYNVEQSLRQLGTLALAIARKRTLVDAISLGDGDAAERAVALYIAGSRSRAKAATLGK